MKQAWRCSHDDQKGDRNARVQRRRDLLKETSLAECTDKPKDEPQEIEFQVLGSLKDQSATEHDDGVDPSVSPRSDRVDWRILPCLESMAIGKVMRWFPVVEDLVTILDRMIERC